MIATTALLLSTLGGCAGQSPEPGSTPEGQACARAYGATVGSVASLLARRGTPDPARWPDEGEYIEHCVALKMSASQVACLDPGRAGSDPDGCADALQTAKSGVDALSRWFNAELKRAAAQREEAEGLPTQVAGAQKGEGSGGHE